MKFDAKKFGSIGLAVAKVMVPQIATVEEAVKDLKSGPDKKAAVVNTVASSLELAEALTGKELVDVPLFMEGLAQVNDGYVKIMKAVHQGETEVQP